MALQRKYTYSAYEVIGLENGAADDHVKQRVKALRVLLHPDGHKPALAPFADDAKALLKRVVQADDALTDKLNHPRDYSLVREKEREIESLKQEIEKLKAGKFDESDIEKERKKLADENLKLQRDLEQQRNKMQKDEADMEEERKKLADENLKLRLDLEQQRNKMQEMVEQYNNFAEEAEKAVYAVKDKNEGLFAELELSHQKIASLKRQKTSGIGAIVMIIESLIKLVIFGIKLLFNWLLKHQEITMPWFAAAGIIILMFYIINITFN